MSAPLLTAAAAGNSGGTLTLPFDCNGAQILFVFAGYWEASDPYPDATYNGVAMTELDAFEGTPARFRWWYLLGPDPGTNDIVITTTGGGTVVAEAAAYTNINLLDPLGSPRQADGNSNASSLGVPGATANDLILTGISFFGGNTGITLDAAGTALADDVNGNARSALASFPYTSGVGGVGWSWTSVGSDSWSQGAILLHGGTQTLYLTNQGAPGSHHGALQVGGVAPAADLSKSRWIPGDINPVPIFYAKLRFGQAAPMSDFGVLPQPSGPPNSADALPGDAYRTGRYRGLVPAGDWTLHIPVIASNAGGSQDGRIRAYIWKGDDPTGAGAVLLTSDPLVGTTVTDLDTVTPQITELTVSLPAFTLHGEYLFFNLAWEITGQGASSDCDVWIMVGPTSFIVTPLLPPEIPWFYAVFYDTQNFLAADADDAHNITARLMAYQSKRGRADALSGIEAGTLQVDLDDDDSAFDPENADSPYYPNVKLKRGLQVLASYGGITYARGTVAIDTYAAKPLVVGADTSIAGADLYKRILQLRSTVNFAAETESFRFANIMSEIGVTGDIVADDVFSAPAASLVDANLLEHVDLLVKAGRGQFWVRANGIPAYWGRHERLNQVSVGSFGAGGDYPIPTPQPVLDDAGLYNQVRVRRTIDGANEIQRFTITGAPTSASCVFNYEGASSLVFGAVLARGNTDYLQHILETISTIGVGNVSVSGGPLPAQPMDIMFIGKLAQTPVAQLTLTDVLLGGGTAPTMTMSTVIEGTDGTQMAEDLASQADYGVIPFTLEDAAADLLRDADDARDWAGWFLLQHSRPTSRFRVIDIDPWVDPANLWPIWFAADIGAVIEVTHDLPGTKGMIAERYYLEGIVEAVTLQGDPTGTFQWLVSRAEVDPDTDAPVSIWVVGVNDTVGDALLVGY